MAVHRQKLLYDNIEIRLIALQYIKPYTKTFVCHYRALYRSSVGNG
jgi:hypothetical protein